MFDCGITTRIQELSDQIIHDQENCIVRAVQELYVDIDKEKLEKCLYDSKSYYDEGLREGYKDGYLEALSQLHEIIEDKYINAGGDIDMIRRI